jgi:large subunit ribosomal protein L10
LIIKGGVLDGKALSAAEVARIADLDSREVLLAKLAGAFKALPTRAAALFQAPLSQMARLAKALEEKKPAGEIAAQGVPEAAAAVVPEIAAEAVPEIAAEGVPEAVPEIAAEGVPETAAEVVAANESTAESADTTTGDTPETPAEPAE